MTWNYRLIDHGENQGERYFAIHEVHYDDTGKPVSVSEDGARIGGETVDDIKDVLERMRGALEKPALRYEDF